MLQVIVYMKDTKNSLGQIVLSALVGDRFIWTVIDLKCI